MFTVGLAVFTLGSELCSPAAELDRLIAFRTVGGRRVEAQSLRRVDRHAHLTDGRERARAIGPRATVVGLSMAAGTLLGGPLVDAAAFP